MRKAYGAEGAQKHSASSTHHMHAQISPKEMTFLQRFSKQDVCETDVITLDHAYCKPWNEHPASSLARPAKYLFVSKPNKKFHHFQSSWSSASDYADIDVSEVPQRPQLAYDANKAFSTMKECERLVTIFRPEESSVDIEDSTFRSGWNAQQLKLFNKAHKVLLMDRLARLAYVEHPNEPVMRRITVDNSAKRMRMAFAAVAWDTSLLTWLHGLLVDVLSFDMMAAYLDVLQTLRTKIPVLIDKIVMQCAASKKMSVAGQEAVALLLNRPWDPVLTAVTQYRAKKLPGNPILLVAPSGPASLATGASSRRMRFWSSQLTSLGKVVPVTMHSGGSGSTMSVKQCLERLVATLRSKIIELKKHFPNRPIVVIGWNAGAVVASYVSVLEPLAALVCLGFPVLGSQGLRGDIDDALLDSRTPTLFVIGQYASSAPLSAMEDLREKMAAESGLVVVGGADDNLNISLKKKKREGINQSVVDRCIQDEISEFLGSVLCNISPSGVDINDADDVASIATAAKKKKRKRKPGVEASLLSGTTMATGAVPNKKRATRPLGYSHAHLKANRNTGADYTTNGSTESLSNCKGIIKERRSRDGISLLQTSSGLSSDFASSLHGVAPKQTAAQELLQQLRLQPPAFGSSLHRAVSAADVATPPKLEARRGVGSSATLHSLATSRLPHSSSLSGAAQSVDATVVAQQQIRHLLTVEGGSTSLLLTSNAAGGLRGQGSVAVERQQLNALSSLSWLGGSNVGAIPSPVIGAGDSNSLLNHVRTPTCDAGDSNSLLNLVRTPANDEPLLPQGVKPTESAKRSVTVPCDT